MLRNIIVSTVRAPDVHILRLRYYFKHKKSFWKTYEEQQRGRSSARQFATEKFSNGKHFKEMFVLLPTFLSKFIEFAITIFATVLEINYAAGLAAYLI